MFGSNAKWWLPRDIESISCVGTCKNDKCKKKFKKGKWKCFSKGNKIQIIVNWTALHTRKALRNFSSKAPQQTSSWLRFCSFIYGWWPRSTLRSQISFRVVWGPHGPPQTICVRAWFRIPIYPTPYCCKSQSVPISISVWLRLKDCFAVFLSTLRVREGEDACGSNGIMALISELPESDVHHQADCKKCCTF